MNTRWIAAATLALLTFGHAQAAGQVEVNWVEPEKFSDIGFGYGERASALRALGEHITLLGRQLPDGQTLRIEVTDINLAGEKKFAPSHDVRVLRGRADWPTMQLRYTLRDGGRELKAGQARLADMGYLFSLRSDAYGYEKRMIDNWFRAEFAPQP